MDMELILHSGTPSVHTTSSSVRCVLETWMHNKHFNMFIQMFKTCFERNVDSHAVVKNNKRLFVPFTGLPLMDNMTARKLTLTKCIDLAT